MLSHAMYWAMLSHRVLGYSVARNVLDHAVARKVLGQAVLHARYWARLCCTSSHNVLGYTVTQGTGLFCHTGYWAILSHRVLGYAVASKVLGQAVLH